VSDQEAPQKPLFVSPKPSAALVPHFITYLDADLLQAVVRVNGAKLGVWNVPAPYGEDDRYEPYRENAPLAAWAMALNQQELLNLGVNISGLVLGNETMIVDSSADEGILAECEKTCGEQGYEDLEDFQKLLAKIKWALIPIDPEHDRALFVASEEKRDYVELLRNWCQQRGRAVTMIALEEDKYTLKHYLAPEEARQQAAIEHGYQYLAKMGHFGISPAEALNAVAEALKRQGQG
jgi:uncharacterized protein YoaH (UPF0181 family)